MIMAKPTQKPTAQGETTFAELAANWLTADEVLARAMSVFRNRVLATRDIVSRLRNNSIKAADLCFTLRDESATSYSLTLLMKLLPASHWDSALGVTRFRGCLGGKVKILGLGRILNEERTKMEIKWDDLCGTYFQKSLIDAAYPTVATATQNNAPDTTLDDAPDNLPTRRRPGRRPTNNWKEKATREVQRVLRNGQPIPTAAKLAKFCATKDFEPDLSDVSKFINELIDQMNRG
jgi:hypothetical protein